MSDSRITKEKAFEMLEEDTSDWDVVQNCEKIFLRKKKMKDSEVEYGRTTAELDIPADELHRILAKPEIWEKYLNGFYDVKILEHIDHDEVIVYAKYWMPGITDRDFVCRIKRYRNVGCYKYLVINESVEHPDAPIDSKYVRGKFNVVWGVMSFGSNRSLFEEIINVDPAGKIPKWMVNIGLGLSLRFYIFDLKRIYPKAKNDGALLNDNLILKLKEK